jgi:hypothetical protein
MKTAGTVNPALFCALGLLLAYALCGPATAQTPAGTPAVACTAPASLSTNQLYGLWQLALWTEGGLADKPASTGTLQFERHPEYPGSVRGSLQRSASGQAIQAQVSGDAIGGAFNLDESADGVTTDAVWEGAPADCGREIRGSRRSAEGRTNTEATMNFLLKKAPGWR